MRLAGPMPAQLIRMRGVPWSAAALANAASVAAALVDVAGDSETVDVARHVDSGLLVDVEDRHLGAGFRQHARGRGAKPRCASGYDRGMSSNVHGRFVRSLDYRVVVMTWGGGGSA